MKKILVLVSLCLTIVACAGKPSNNSPEALAKALVHAMIERDRKTIESLYSSNAGFFVGDLDTKYKYFNNQKLSDYTFKEVDASKVLVTKPGMPTITIKIIREGESYYWQAVLDPSTGGDS